MTISGPLAQALDAVAAGRSADQRQLTSLARELRAHLPRRQVAVTRRGFPLIGSRVVGLRVLVGERVFRIDITTGVPVTETGRALNGVVSAHTRVSPDQWALGLRAALDGSAGGIGPAFGPLQ